MRRGGGSPDPAWRGSRGGMRALGAVALHARSASCAQRGGPHERRPKRLSRDPSALGAVLAQLGEQALLIGCGQAVAVAGADAHAKVASDPAHTALVEAMLGRELGHGQALGAPLGLGLGLGLGRGLGAHVSPFLVAYKRHPRPMRSHAQ